MSTIEAWPFIVARNATLDWRPILAPPFLIDAHADYLLVTETSVPGGDPTNTGLSVVESTNAGTITLVFRSTAATSDLLGRTPPKPLLDRFGRPLHIVEGLAVRGGYRSPPNELRRAVDHVRGQTLRLLPAFWDEETEIAAATRSEPVLIGDVTEIASGRTQERGGDAKYYGRRTLILALAVTIALGAGACWWWARR